MKRVITFIAELTIGVMVVTFVTACFFGAVLQESYKLSPQTAAEVALQLGISLASLGESRQAAERLQESVALFLRAGATDRSGHAKALAESLVQDCQG